MPPHNQKLSSLTLASLTLNHYTAVTAADTVWHTLAAIGSNFDSDGFYNLRRLSWPSSFAGTSMEDLAAADFFQRGSREAFCELFSSGGKCWATMKTLNIAHKYFREIKETGVLGIFPFGLQANIIQVRDAQDHCILNLLCPQKLGEASARVPDMHSTCGTACADAYRCMQALYQEPTMLIRCKENPQTPCM